MSFSGLKTAALNLIHNAEQVHEALDINSICASFCSAVSDILVPRVVQALEKTGHKKLAVAGGVAANSVIRRDIIAAAKELGVDVYLPPLSLCGDNASMIGAQAYYEYINGVRADSSLNAFAVSDT
jgi:N6-L-threonylcarbamoyladenine synthase